ncbi:hypothetical protein AB0H85_29330, partial [Streptomyces sp. NPDC051000]
PAAPAAARSGAAGAAGRPLGKPTAGERCGREAGALAPRPVVVLSGPAQAVAPSLTCSLTVTNGKFNAKATGASPGGQGLAAADPNFTKGYADGSAAGLASAACKGM